FIRYFGPYAAALLKKDSDTIVCAIRDCRPTEGILRAQNGRIVNGMNIVGYISCKDELEGYIKNDMFIAKPVAQKVLNTRLLPLKPFTDVEVLQVKTEIRDNKPVVSFYKGEDRVAESLHRFYAVLSSLNGKNITVKLDRSGSNKTQNCEIMVL
ncbi:MAG: hypothetical protein IJZ25_04570, partial [Lachnospiraceae bacterium]|nr:hypothetical protein [Lachnospiraceae bacterium]